MDPTDRTGASWRERGSSLAARRLALAWVAGMVLVGALQAARPLSDGDLFWHLAIGRQTLEAGRLLTADPLTFTIPDSAWVQHEWGGEVLLAFVDRLGGLRALRLLQALLAAAFLALLALAMYRVSGGRPLLTGLLVTLAWLGAEPNVGLRPQMLGWILAVWAFGIAWCGRPPSSTPRATAAAFLLAVAWVNVHSSALLLPIAAGAACLDALLFGSRPTLLAWLRRFAAVAAGILCSPSGVTLLAYAVETPRANLLSQEWRPLLSASSWGYRPTLVLLAALLIPVCVLVVAAAWRNRGRFEPLFPGPIVAVAFLLLALEHRRMATFLFVPLLAAALAARAFLSSTPGARPEALPQGLSKLLALTLCATTLVVAFRHAVSLAGTPALRAESFPVEATEFLREAGFRGRLLNPPEWGGYLAYHLGARIRTYVDGRWLELGHERFAEGVLMLLHRADPALYERHGIDVLVQSTAQFLASPPLPPDGWRLAWIDPRSVVLLRRDADFESERRLACAFRRAHPEATPYQSWPAALVRGGAGALPPLTCDEL